MSSKNKNSFRRWLTKTFVVNTTVFMMIVSPLPLNQSSSYAQSDAAIFAQYAIGGLKQAGDIYLNARQQSFAMANQAGTMSSLRPKTVPDKYFGCPIPTAVSDFPAGACENPIASQQEVMQVSNYKTVADGFISFYEQISANTNSRFSVGLQCIEDSRKQVQAGAQKRINDLTRLATQIKKNNQAFRDGNQKLLDDISDLNYELNGSSGAKNSKDSTNTKTKDFTNLFPPGCRDSLLNEMGGQVNDLVKKGGMLGLRTGLQRSQQSAGRYVSQKASYERDLNKKIQKIKSDIEKRGFEVWANKQNASVSNGGNIIIPGSVGQDSFKAAAAVVRDQLTEYAVSKQTYLKNITDLGIKGVNEGTSIQDAEKLAKKAYVHDCVTMNDKGVGLDLNEIYRSLRHPSTNNEGNKVRNFRIALKDIMNNSELDIDQKMEEVGRLQNEFGSGSITMRYYDPNRNLKTSTPYEVFKGIVSQCEGSFSRNESDKMGTLKKNLSSLQQLDSDFTTSVVSAIDDQVRNCGGNEYKTNMCSGGSSFDVGATSFCLKHADACASQINSCFAKVEQEVNKRTNSINNKAQIYNQNVEVFVAQQDQLLNQVRAMMETQGEVLRRMFPEGQFNLPDDLLVEMPKEDDRLFGVMLRGGGSMDFIQALPEKLEDLKAELAAQQAQIDKEIQGYIVEQQANIKKNLDKWSKLKKNCTAQLNDYTQRVNNQYADDMKNYNEGMAKAGKFCNRFDRLKDMNPAAGCDEVEKLFTETAEVTGYINTQADQVLTQYKNVCASSQSEKSDEEGDDPLLVRMCNKHGSWNGVKDEVVSNLANHPEMTMNASQIKKYIEGKGGKIPKKLPDNLVAALKNAKDIFAPNAKDDEDKKDDTSSTTNSLAEVQSALKRELSNFGPVGLTLPDNAKSDLEKAITQDLTSLSNTAMDSFAAKLGNFTTKIKAAITAKLELPAGTTGKIDQAGATALETKANDFYTAMNKIVTDGAGRSTASTASTDSELEEKILKNPCRYYKDEAKFVAKSCKADGGKDCGDESARKKERRLLDEDFDDLPISGGVINSGLVSISSVAFSSSSDNVKWAAIGEQDIMSCMALDASQMRYDPNDPYAAQDPSIYGGGIREYGK